jgi:large subunit ribosomal protein L25
VRFELQGEPREVANRGGTRRLRKLGRVPAVVYGGGAEPRIISLDHHKLIHQMEHEAFYTSILTISLGKESQAVVVKDVQRHPARAEIMHLDFQRIVEDEEITLHVPIHFVGEVAAKGVKEQGGVIEHMATDVEISCLPRYLPEYLELDVSHLELNQIMNLSDIVLPEGVTSVALQHGQDLPVVAINPPRREEEEEAAAGEGEAAAAAVAPPAEPTDGDSEA